MSILNHVSSSLANEKLTGENYMKWKSNLNIVFVTPWIAKTVTLCTYKGAGLANQVINLKTCLQTCKIYG